MRVSLPQWCVGLALVIAVVGCKSTQPVPMTEPPPDYNRQLPPGERALVKLTDPSQYPDFSGGFGRKTGLEQAAMYSLEYLSRPSSKQFFPYGDVTHERAVASIEAFLDVIRTARSPEELDQTIKQRFDIYISRGCDDRGTVLYTGYYRPIFDARRKPDAEFKYPLYKRPADIEGDPITGVYQRKGGGPYLTREEIDRGALAGKGLELVWLRDRFETYIVTVQGSGRLRMEDGSLFDIGYHGNNGYEYTSIGQKLVEEGAIGSQDLSLQGLIRFFKQHPEKLDSALAVNKRYVFFTPRGGGPYGSLNVPVTPFRSIATDKQVYPRACVSFLVTQLPAQAADGQIRPYEYEGFALDQDTGGAIRAAGRCDVFMGTGPKVGELAGRTFAEGKLYYIFVKQDGAASTMLASPGAPSASAEFPDPGPGS
ncbi:MAG TPA: MltA domain-containing protein [Phycisphaerae bacterium]|nr:MltA domain-containing protein [Phycisphaerae bacterium]